MDNYSLTQSLVMDLVDNWRDESHTHYLGRRLLDILKADKENVISILDSRTVIVNLYFVIFDIILTSEFRHIFARIVQMVASTPHFNSMFLFGYITGKKGDAIYDCIRLGLETSDFQLLDILFQVRANLGKQSEFRLEYTDVSKTGYARLTHNKVALYRDYFARKTVNIKICSLILKDLYSSLVGQNPIKDTFCKKNGLNTFVNIVRAEYWKTSANLTSRTVLWCNVIGTLLEAEAKDVSHISTNDAISVCKNTMDVIVEYESDSSVIEAALALLLKTYRFLGDSAKSIDNCKSTVDIVMRVKSMHSNNINIYQNCAILQMMTTAVSKVGDENELTTKPRTGHRSSRWKSWVRDNRRQRRAQSSKNFTTTSSASDYSKRQSPEYDKSSRAASANINREQID